MMDDGPCEWHWQGDGFCVLYEFLRNSKIYPPKNLQIPPSVDTERTSTWHSKRKTKLPENCARNRKHENNENLSGTHVLMFVFSGR